MSASSSTSTASKCLLWQAGGGRLPFKPMSQGLHQQPRSFQPWTSLEGKASASRSALLSGLVSQARGTAAASLHRQKRAGKRLSRTDSETKPVGALWIIAGFTADENHSQPDAGMPCRPCAACCQASRGRQKCQAQSLLPGKLGLGGAVPGQDWGI